jgi:hypothetical protein
MPYDIINFYICSFGISPRFIWPIGSLRAMREEVSALREKCSNGFCASYEKILTPTIMKALAVLIVKIYTI